MKRIAFVGFWACTLALLSGLIVRLLWLALPTETGPQNLWLTWRSTTAGWLLDGREPIGSRDPPEQAAFWLLEANRVLETRPNDARLAMGAALVLDSPDTEFEGKYMTALAPECPELATFPKLDENRLRQAEDAFEGQCKARCLELAAKAVQLDPTNVDWWQLRALLLRRPSSHSSDRAPRDLNWLAVLEDSQRHDPNNALYDYLAANYYWEVGATVDFSNGKERLVIKDADLFVKGIDRFEQGQAKQRLAVGDAGFTAAAEFLGQTRIPSIYQERIVNSRTISLRRSLLLIDLWRWQGYRAQEKASADDVAGALALERQNLHVIAQYMQGGAGAAYDLVAIAGKAATAARMTELADQHKDLLSAAEAAQIDDLLQAAMLDKKVMQNVGQKLNEGKPALRQGSLTPDSATAACGMVCGVALSLAVPLFLVGLAAAILSLCFARRDVPVLGPVGQAFALLSAIALSVSVFGLAPAGIISRDVQTWFFVICSGIAPVVVISWLGWRWVRRARFRLSVRTVLTGAFVVSLLLGTVYVGLTDIASFVGSPSRLSIPLRSLGGWNAGFVNATLTRGYGEWFSAAYQWGAYHGECWAILLWAGLVAALCTLKMRAATSQNIGGSLGWRSLLGGLFRSLARPAFVMSAMMFMVYLILAPGLQERAEQEFQQKITFARHPERYWTKVEKVVQTVRSDEHLMGQLRDAVKVEMSKPATSARERSG